jgi:hypothetical protein
MNKILAVILLALSVVLVSTQAIARRGADDPAGHVRQGRGADDAVAGNVHQCRGCDDPVGHVSGRDRVRDPAASGRRGHGADDPAGHVSGGHGADDGPDHEANEHITPL